MKKIADLAKMAKECLVSRKCQQVTLDGSRYYLSQDKRLTSVTTYVSSFYPFSPKKAIEMMKSANTFDIKHPGKTEDDVIKEWNLIGLKAAREGTEMHKDIEMTLTGLERSGNYEKEILHMKQFIKDNRLFYVSGEVSIFDEDLGLAGTFDALFISEMGLFYLIDWKRSLKVEQNIDKHKLQLLTYSNILYNKYKIKIHKCIIVGLHSTLDSYKSYDFDAFINIKASIDNELRNIEVPANWNISDLIYYLDCRIPIGIDNIHLNKFLYKCKIEESVSTKKITVDFLNENDWIWRKILSSKRLLGKLMTELCIDEKFCNTNGETILHQLVKYKHLDSIGLLLDMGANIHARSFLGTTPYNICLEQQDNATLDLLIEKQKIDIDGFYCNETPLTFSIKNSLKKIFSHILFRGANPYKKNKRGRTPLKISMRKTDRFFSNHVLKYINIRKI